MGSQSPRNLGLERLWKSFNANSSFYTQETEVKKGQVAQNKYRCELLKDLVCLFSFAF